MMHTTQLVRRRRRHVDLLTVGWRSRLLWLLLLVMMLLVGWVLIKHHRLWRTPKLRPSSKAIAVYFRTPWRLITKLSELRLKLLDNHQQEMLTRSRPIMNWHLHHWHLSSVHCTCATSDCRSPYRYLEWVHWHTDGRAGYTCPKIDTHAHWHRPMVIRTIRVNYGFHSMALRCCSMFCTDGLNLPSPSWPSAHRKSESTSVNFDSRLGQIWV